MTNAADDDVLIFQDVLPSISRHAQHDSDDAQLSLAFFDLANARYVGYRLEKSKSRKEDGENLIVVRQDTGACGNHTGGIVWETSYLLLEYLLSRRQELGRLLEVGAGCGMLGIALASSGWSKYTVLTETREAMENLKANVKRNERFLVKSKKRQTKSIAVARRLQWEKCEQDLAQSQDDLRSQSFDTIVGTDVVFTPSLVEPLLYTLRYMAHDNTEVLLCLQVRCPDSHQLLLEKATEHDLHVTEITSDLASIPTCAWGLDMECRLLRLTVLSKKDPVRVRRKRKKGSELNDSGCQRQKNKNDRPRAT